MTNSDALRRMLRDVEPKDLATALVMDWTKSQIESLVEDLEEELEMMDDDGD